MTKYPLEQLMTIKKNRFDQAVRILEEKKALLEKAQAKLDELTRHRDEVASHKAAKLAQLRAALDEGFPTDKIQQMKVYLKVVDEELLEKEKKVTEQKKQVDLAQNQVDLATTEMFQRKKDVEKLEIHHEEWQKEMRHLEARKEEGLTDEQGSATHSIRKQDEKRREKNRDS